MSSQISPSSPLPNSESSSIEGLEDFFEESTTLHSDGGLTIKQAVHYFNLSARKIKKAIKNGEIAATYQSGEKGSRWRVFPNGVPERLSSRAFVPQLPAVIEEPTQAISATAFEVNELKDLVVQLCQRIDKLETERLEQQKTLMQALQQQAEQSQRRYEQTNFDPRHVDEEVMLISAEAVEPPKPTLLNRVRTWLRRG